MSQPQHPLAASPRPIGLSAFVRCKNEQEFIVASLMSGYRVFDEIVVILNNSTDKTRELVEDLIADHPKIRLLEYSEECASVGAGYHERVLAAPNASLARYYNWCLEQTRFSHVCKWDGDMIATPELERVRALITSFDMVLFDGYDVLGQETTSMEPRIFKFDPQRAKYVDWDLYEVIDHNYGKLAYVQQKCYLHMKLVKREWLHETWTSPNLLATRSPPPARMPPAEERPAMAGTFRQFARRLLRRSANG
jgi:glycosyltransferase involved in cell wall biosynthesis